MWYELIQCTPGVSTAEKMARLVDMVTTLNLEGLEAVIFAGEQEIREMLPVALKLKLDTDREEDVVRAVGRIIEDYGDCDFFDDVFDVRMGTVERPSIHGVLPPQAVEDAQSPDGDEHRHTVHMPFSV